VKTEALSNDIFVVYDFIPEPDVQSLLEYFKIKQDDWKLNGFFESYSLDVSMSDEKICTVGLEIDYFYNLFLRMQNMVSKCFGKEVVRMANHIQKWNAGSYSQWHSDNSDADGRPNAWEMNKYASIIYINDDFDGGELEFKHGLVYKPVARSLIVFDGGAHNIHKVNQVMSGVRYTAGAFWDHADAFYSDERRQEWADEIRRIREEQASQYSEWEENKEFYVEHAKTIT
jgi:hypothetical protein